MPPPTQNGFLLVTTQARPVPFCLQGFLELPLTSALVLVEAVPTLRLANSFLIALYIEP